MGALFEETDARFAALMAEREASLVAVMQGALRRDRFDRHGDINFSDPFQRIGDHLHLERHLLAVIEMLQFAPAAFRKHGARRRHPVGGLLGKFDRTRHAETRRGLHDLAPGDISRQSGRDEQGVAFMMAQAVAAGGEGLHFKLQLIAEVDGYGLFFLGHKSRVSGLRETIYNAINKIFLPLLRGGYRWGWF